MIPLLFSFPRKMRKKGFVKLIITYGFNGSDDEIHDSSYLVKIINIFSTQEGAKETFIVVVTQAFSCQLFC